MARDRPPDLFLLRAPPQRDGGARGQGEAGPLKPGLRVLLVLFAAAALLFGRGFFRELGRRFAFAFLLFLTLITVSVLVRAFQGEDQGWALVALAFLGPSLMLAWRDHFRR